MQCMWLAKCSYQCSIFTPKSSLQGTRISVSKIWRFRRFRISYLVSSCSFSFFFLAISCFCLSFLLFSFSLFFFEDFREEGPEGFRSREEGPDGFRPREEGPEGFRPREEGPEGFRPREELAVDGRKSKCGKGIGSLLLVPSDFLRLDSQLQQKDICWHETSNLIRDPRKKPLRVCQISTKTHCNPSTFSRKKLPGVSV